MQNARRHNKQIVKTSVWPPPSKDRWIYGSASLGDLPCSRQSLWCQVESLSESRTVLMIFWTMLATRRISYFIILISWKISRCWGHLHVLWIGQIHNFWYLESSFSYQPRQEFNSTSHITNNSVLPWHLLSSSHENIIHISWRALNIMPLVFWQ